MAITDINISEQLETNAPSIRYRGNEGPKSPQEMEKMIMAQLEEEYLKYVDEMIEIGKEPMSLQQFMEQAIAEGQMSGGQPLPQDPTKPVNPFGPRPTGPVLPDRQMAAFGGIMGVDGRRKYGIGSKLKKFVRKVIPNEVADIAVTAAPFIAPFNPLAAAVAGGLGSFDQTGSISKGLKSGLMNYALGQGARYLGGADFQRGINPFAGENFGFSMPTGEGGIKNLFKDKIKPSDGTYRMSTFTKDFAPVNEVGTTFGYDDALGGEMLTTGTKIAKTAKDTKNTTGILKAIKDFALDNKLLTGLAAGSIGTAALMDNMQPDELQDLQRGEGLDIQGIRKEVQEALQDSTGEKLAALRSKYPFLGRRDTKDMAEGGRASFSGGKLAKFLADKTITGSSRRFLEKVFGKESFERMIENDPELYRGLLETVEMFRNRDKEGLKMYMQKFLPHMDDATVEDFIIGSGGTEGIEGQLIRLGSGRDYAGKIDMMKKADNMKKLDNLDVKDLKPNAMGGRITKAEGGLMDLGGLEKDYRNTGGFVDIGAKEKADDVPARLSVNEFVFTADAVRNAGGGNIDKGAQVMENMMKHLEQGGQVSRESQGMSGARDMFAVSERLSEVV